MTPQTQNPVTLEGDAPSDESPMSADVLIEEVSIDGMCGVY